MSKVDQVTKQTERPKILRGTKNSHSLSEQKRIYDYKYKQFAFASVHTQPFISFYVD